MYIVEGNMDTEIIWEEVFWEVSAVLLMKRY